MNIKKVLKFIFTVSFLIMIGTLFFVHVQNYQKEQLSQHSQKIKRLNKQALIDNILKKYQTPAPKNIEIKKLKNIEKILKKSIHSKKRAFTKRPRPTKKRSAPSLHKKKVAKFNKSNIKREFSGWGLNKNKASVHIIDAWKKFINKKQVVVAVIDTGIDPYHPFLKNNIYVPKHKTTTLNFGVDFSYKRKFKKRPFDSHGHGTHVAGIIKSIIPNVKILALKYYNPGATGQQNLESTIKALAYAVEQNVDIINYSGGGPEPSHEELRILKLAQKKGIFIAAAAGNEESNIDIQDNAYYPASYKLKNILSVTAHNKDSSPLRSSNYGPASVDISAPGKRIKSSLPNGRGGFLSGTSQATAFVSGAAALIKAQYPELTPIQIKHAIVSSANKIRGLSRRSRSRGTLNIALALNKAKRIYLKKYSNVVMLPESKNQSLYDKIRVPSSFPSNLGGEIFFRPKK